MISSKEVMDQVQSQVCANCYGKLWDQTRKAGSDRVLEIHIKIWQEVWDPVIEQVRNQVNNKA